MMLNLIRSLNTARVRTMSTLSSTSCVSHWQATNRGPSSLYGWNKDATPDATADVVIVGAGTMGASLAYFLTRQGAWSAGKKVVVLEGRDVGSGASGRNGVSTTLFLFFFSHETLSC